MEYLVLIKGIDVLMVKLVYWKSFRILVYDLLKKDLFKVFIWKKL